MIAMLKWIQEILEIDKVLRNNKDPDYLTYNYLLLT